MISVNKIPYQCHFYPRSPCGERPETDITLIGNIKFLSTLSLRRATNSRTDNIKRNEISIHALLAESDEQSASYNAYLEDFYPRSPCGERLSPALGGYNVTVISIHALLAESDASSSSSIDSRRLFLSTLSLRRATP